jgi:8-oxo-dGTP diphosphatase
MTHVPPDAIAAASMCLWRASEVLLVKRPEGVWALPGGKVEPGESTAEAAEREIFEETGIVAEALEVLGVFEITSPKNGLRYVLRCHFGQWISGEAKASSDALDVLWATVDGLRTLPLAPHVKSVILASTPLARL